MNEDDQIVKVYIERYEKEWLFTMSEGITGSSTSFSAATKSGGWRRAAEWLGIE